MAYTNFSVEVAKRNVDEEDASVIAEFSTNNVLELSQYIGEAMTYFQGMVKFDSTVSYVGLLIRCYRDHHAISIRRDNRGMLQVITNQ